jgi:hypothetical protein
MFKRDSVLMVTREENENEKIECKGEKGTEPTMGFYLRMLLLN